jgi:hypothetical protein
VDVVIPGEVVQVPLSAGDHESCREYEGPFTRHASIVSTSAAKLSPIKVEEIGAVIGAKAFAARAPQVAWKYKRRHPTCTTVGLHRRTIELAYAEHT